MPETFWTTLRSASLQDGSLARFLIFRSIDDIPDRNRAPALLSDIPAPLIAALQAVAAGAPRSGRGNLVDTGAPTITPDPHPAPTAPAAARLFEDLDEEITRRQRQAIGSGHGAVLARVWENTAKVALIKAVSANPAEPIIRVEDAEWARDVVAHCVETLLTEAERHIADNDTERNHKRVLEIIRGAGEQGFTKSELIRRTQFLDKRQRDDILEALVDSGQIGTAMRATATKPVMVLRVTKETPAK